MSEARTFEEEVEHLKTFTEEEEIAQLLRERGVTGVPRDGSCCVLANLLSPYLDYTGWQVEVDEPFITLKDPQGNPVETWSTTAALTDFINGFDAHCYPELETPGELCGEQSCRRCYPKEAA